MPSKTTKKKKNTGPTRTDVISDWLTANPGWHSPVDVATGTGYDTSRAASALLYLARKDKVERMRGRVNNGPGSSVYAAKKPTK